MLSGTNLKEKNLTSLLFNFAFTVKTRTLEELALSSGSTNDVKVNPIQEMAPICLYSANQKNFSSYLTLEWEAILKHLESKTVPLVNLSRLKLLTLQRTIKIIK